MVKIYKQPFAHAGAKQVIPDASDPQGFVSNADGFTTDYELPDTDPNYKPIERAEFNGLMNTVTESLGEIQQFGFAKWQAMTWPQGARVVEGGVVYRALVQTSQQPPHADWVPDSIGAITGKIEWFAFNTAPDGYLVCNGANISRETYADLFAVIGTAFGVGDGSTTFALPDLRDRVIQGASATHALAQYIEAGLPNITGEAGFTAPSHTTPNGAFYSNERGSCSSGQTLLLYTQKFDASRSSSIYGKSSTVQPPALTLLPCIKY